MTEEPPIDQNHSIESDPELADLVREGRRIRSLEQARRKRAERLGLLPSQAYPDPEKPQLTDSDIAYGRRLALRHGQDLRFTPERKWFVWDGRRWAADD